MWPFKKKINPLDAECDEAVRLYWLKDQSPVDMARWIEFRNIGLMKRGHIPILQGD